MGLILGDPNAEMLPAVLGRNGDLFGRSGYSVYLLHHDGVEDVDRFNR